MKTYTFIKACRSRAEAVQIVCRMRTALIILSTKSSLTKALENKTFPQRDVHRRAAHASHLQSMEREQ